MAAIDRGLSEVFDSLMGLIERSEPRLTPQVMTTGEAM